MKNKFLQYTLLCCSLMVLFSACRKDPFNGKETKDSGKTFVYITEAQQTNQFFDVFTDIKPVTMFSVRRDAANPSDLQKAVTVKLAMQNQAFITAHAGANYTAIPGSLFTLGAQPGVAMDASGNLTLSFAGGDFAKNIIFNVDGSKVDLSKQYAVAYVITDFGGFSKEHAADGTAQDTIISTVAIKNQYDGVYDYTGVVNRQGDAVLGGTVVAGTTVEFATTSATTNTTRILWADGATEVGGVNPIILSIDPATNKVTVTSGPNATLMNIPGSENSYDPATKTFTLNFVWNGTDPDFRGAHLVLTYKGPR